MAFHKTGEGLIISTDDVVFMETRGVHGEEGLCVGDAWVTERWSESRVRKCS